jgi:tripartite-type tricarboxylate transporter receptor subunit TctC
MEGRVSRRIVFASLALLVVGGVAGLATAQPAETVHLIVDYGDGTMKAINDIPWSQGQTVLDMMNAAKARPRGITFESRGSGPTALLTKIDDLASQGGGSGAKNWQFWVNEAYGNRSFGIYEVKPQDTVLWRFAEQSK